MLLLQPGCTIVSVNMIFAGIKNTFIYIFKFHSKVVQKGGTFHICCSTILCLCAFVGQLISCTLILLKLESVGVIVLT
jgi:hypothetical protein